MQDNEFFFSQDDYSEHLKIINGVHFTRREVDVIACLISMRGTSKIASLLFIAPRTVVTHMRNIMLKLDCNSREGIIDFIERSGGISFIRQHYTSLLINQEFEKSLKEIAKLKREEALSSLILYWQNQNWKNILLHHLKNHLKCAGVPIEIREKEEGRQINDKSTKIQNLTSIFLLEKEKYQKIPQDLAEFYSVELEDQKNYYFLVFDILKKLFSHANLDKIASEFKKYYEMNNNSYEKVYAQTFLKRNELKNKSKDSFSMFSNILKDEERNISVCSELVIPATSVLLNRDELLTQITEALNNEEDIATIALVGIAGAGKTTIARQYARSQKRTIVWEINAETQESLICSFDGLAYALSQTEEEKKMLRGLQDINNPREKEEKFVQFVKEKLRIQQDWLLIYDNIEKFTDIQKCFPFDASIWGRGQIILTTRDRNIQHNAHIHHSISVGELNANDALTLFCNIINNGSANNFNIAQKEQAVSFLNHIPFFPLDVSIAAYYLRTTNISYEKYIEHLNEYNENFENIQEDILRETTQYTKTRYNIITLSLKRLIDSHKDFEELLLLISLLDSQNIPRDILISYKDEVTVDNFIYHLKKYSLTICRTSNYSQPASFFNIHRSTQEISLAYLKKKLNLDKNNHYVNSIANMLEKFVICISEKVDFVTMKILKSHCTRFLSHDKLLTTNIKESISGILGNIHFCLGNYTKAKLFLEESLVNLNKKERENPNQLVLFLGYLGCTYLQLGDYKKAKSLLEQSYAIYKRIIPENNMRHAWILVNLGTVEMKLGNFYESKNLFEQSLMIYKAHSPKDKNGTSWCFAHLGIIEKELNNYSEAKTLLETSLNTYCDNGSMDNIKNAWSLRHLAHIYREAGSYEKAKESIDQSLTFYKQYFPEDHVKVAKANVELGNINSMIGNYEKAKNLLDESLLICEQHFGSDHIETAQVLEDLGQVYYLEGNLETANNLIMKALRIFQDNNHPKAYRSLESLAEVYLKKSTQAVSKKDGLDSPSQELRSKAIFYLNQAIDVTKNTFTKDSPHTTRIKSKLEKLRKDNAFHI